MAMKDAPLVDAPATSMQKAAVPTGAPRTLPPSLEEVYSCGRPFTERPFTAAEGSGRPRPSGSSLLHSAAAQSAHAESFSPSPTDPPSKRPCLQHGSGPGDTSGTPGEGAQAQLGVMQNEGAALSRFGKFVSKQPWRKRRSTSAGHGGEASQMK
jgi:hypothetical protein